MFHILNAKIILTFRVVKYDFNSYVIDFFTIHVIPITVTRTFVMLNCSRIDSKMKLFFLILNTT